MRSACRRSGAAHLFPVGRGWAPIAFGAVVDFRASAPQQYLFMLVGDTKFVHGPLPLAAAALTLSYLRPLPCASSALI